MEENYFSRQKQIPMIDLNKAYITREVADLIPASLAKRYRLVPVERDRKTITIAMEDPFNFIAIEDVKRITGLEVIPCISSTDFILQYINQLYGIEQAENAMGDFIKEISNYGSDVDWVQTISDAVAGSPVVRLVDSLIHRAVSQKSSDIHIEPMKKEVRIRFRIDGLLETVMNMPMEIHTPIITRIKIMGNMNIAEKRKPQDGRCEMKIMDENIDIRISTMPTVHGEKAVLRILDRNYFLFPKEDLGFSKNNMDKFNSFMDLSHGLILITGPTGSGKSTTLYTMLNEMNDDSRNITTIEDPVECHILGVSQIQVNSKGGVTFPVALRSVLRQDPDIIMVGEIRDQDTAEMAIRAAITGHLVLSTIHTHDAAGAISRLLDMGVKNYLLADALAGIISQRLIRQVCDYCRQPYQPKSSEFDKAGLPHDTPGSWFKGVGCITCNHTGFMGRTAVHEILMITKEIRELISKGASREKFMKCAIEQGMRPLKEACVTAFQSGITTLEEIISILYNL